MTLPETLLSNKIESLVTHKAVFISKYQAWKQAPITSIKMIVESDEHLMRSTRKGREIEITPCGQMTGHRTFSGKSGM